MKRVMLIVVLFCFVQMNILLAGLTEKTYTTYFFLDKYGDMCIIRDKEDNFAFKWDKTSPSSLVFDPFVLKNINPGKEDYTFFLLSSREATPIEEFLNIGYVKLGELPAILASDTTEENKQLELFLSEKFYSEEDNNLAMYSEPLCQDQFSPKLR